MNREGVVEQMPCKKKIVVDRQANASQVSDDAVAKIGGGGGGEL